MPSRFHISTIHADVVIGEGEKFRRRAPLHVAGQAVPPLGPAASRPPFPRGVASQALGDIEVRVVTGVLMRVVASDAGQSAALAETAARHQAYRLKSDGERVIG